MQTSYQKNLQVKESDIQKGIIDYLRVRGAVVVKFNNTGIYKANEGRYITVSQKGVSDLLCCYKGHFIAIEVKRPGNKATTEQEAFLESIREKGGFSMIAYLIKDVIIFLDSI